MMITEFLLARIDEDEEDLEMARIGDSPEWWEPTMWNRKRAEAECEVRRRILELHDDLLKKKLAEDDASAWGADLMHMDVLKLLALVYADHPDYEEAWRP